MACDGDWRILSDEAKFFGGEQRLVSEIGMIIKYKNFPITQRRVKNIA
jgi:hypothetical protein